jgi:hypothetical protein
VPVLLLEGDTLIGCWQNRVATHTVLVPPGATMQIPVACMEQGRWGSSQSRSFQIGGMRMETAVRRATAHERARSSNGQVNQNRVWVQVRDRLSRAQVRSATLDYGEFVRDRSTRGAGVPNLLPGQVGAAVGHGSQLVAIELTSHPRLWRELSSRALPAHLVDAGEMPRRAGTVSLRQCVDRLAASTVDATPGLGAGTDLTVSGDALVGAGLSWGGAVAHLAVFGC